MLCAINSHIHTSHRVRWKNAENWNKVVVGNTSHSILFLHSNQIDENLAVAAIADNTVRYYIIKMCMPYNYIVDISCIGCVWCGVVWCVRSSWDMFTHCVHVPGLWQSIILYVDVDVCCVSVGPISFNRGNKLSCFVNVLLPLMKFGGSVEVEDATAIQSS